MRDHTPTPAPLPIDLPEETPDQDSPIGGMRMLVAVGAITTITAFVAAVGMVAGFGPFAAVILGGVLAIVIGIGWLVWWPSDRRLRDLLRWWL